VKKRAFEKDRVPHLSKRLAKRPPRAGLGQRTTQRTKVLAMAHHASGGGEENDDVHRAAGPQRGGCPGRVGRGCMHPPLASLAVLVLLALPAGRTDSAPVAGGYPASRRSTAPPASAGFHLRPSYTEAMAGRTQSALHASAVGDLDSWDSRLFESESSWKNYQKLVPPRRHGGAGDTDLASVALRDGAVASRPVDGQRKRATLMLDLDKTCLLGNDGNDLGLCLQWMNRSPEVVRELYKRILSPSLRQAYESYRARSDVDVVIYTRRPQLLCYRSCVTGEAIRLKYDESWHDDMGQVYIPSSVRDGADVLAHYRGPCLDKDEENDVMKGMERLLAARDAIAHELGLLELPPVVVTAAPKEVEKTARHLGLDPNTSILYDDNVALAGDSRVVLVEPLRSLPRAQRDELLRFMDKNLPVEELEEDLLYYLEGANPGEESLRYDALTDRIAWWVPELPGGGLKMWRIADVLKDAAAEEASLRANKIRLKVHLSASCGVLPSLARHDGSTSPVTGPATPALDESGQPPRLVANQPPPLRVSFSTSLVDSLDAERRLLLLKQAGGSLLDEESGVIGDDAGEWM